MSEQLIQELLSNLARLGPLFTVLIIIVVTGYKQHWVYKWQYLEVVRDRDFWRSTALRALNIAERKTNVEEHR